MSDQAGFARRRTVALRASCGGRPSALASRPGLRQSPASSSAERSRHGRARIQGLSASRPADGTRCDRAEGREYFGRLQALTSGLIRTTDASRVRWLSLIEPPGSSLSEPSTAEDSLPLDSEEGMLWYLERIGRQGSTSRERALQERSSSTRGCFARGALATVSPAALSRVPEAVA
jgi:hypothetical protein